MAKMCTKSGSAVLITCKQTPLCTRHVRGETSSSLVAALITSQHLQFKQPTLILSDASLSAPSAEARPLQRAAASKPRPVWLTPEPVTLVESRPPPNKGSFALMLSESVPSCNDAVFPCLPDSGLMASISSH